MFLANYHVQVCRLFFSNGLLSVCFSQGDSTSLENDIGKGHPAQSVSWFVPLNGVQREPLRHSIVEVVPDEISPKVREMF